MTLPMQHLNKDTFIMVPYDYNNTCTITFPFFFSFYGFIVLIGVLPSEITKFEFEKEKEMMLVVKVK